MSAWLQQLFTIYRKSIYYFFAGLSFEKRAATLSGEIYSAISPPSSARQTARTTGTGRYAKLRGSRHYSYGAISTAFSPQLFITIIAFTFFLDEEKHRRVADGSADFD